MALSENQKKYIYLSILGFIIVVGTIFIFIYDKESFEPLLVGYATIFLYAIIEKILGIPSVQLLLIIVFICLSVYFANWFFNDYYKTIGIPLAAICYIITKKLMPRSISSIIDDIEAVVLPGIRRNIPHDKADKPQKIHKHNKYFKWKYKACANKKNIAANRNKLRIPIQKRNGYCHKH